MKKNESDIDKIEKELIAACAKEEKFEASPYFQTKVMSELRQTSMAGEKDILSQWVWRFASVSGTCALVFLTYAFAYGISPQGEIVNVITWDPIGIMAAQPMGF